MKLWYTLLFFTAFLALPTNSNAQALDTTLHFRSGGSIKIAIQKSKGRTCWKQKFYQINGNLHLSIRDGEVINETKNFVLTGFLNKGRSPRFVGLSIDGQFALYENEYFYLKFPLTNGHVMFMQKNDLPLGSMGSRDLWQILPPAES